MMSKKCKYAIKALVELAKHSSEGSMFTRDIAKNQNIPQKFLEQILTELKQNGFVGSKKGYGGGIHLRKAPDQITVADIYRLFDGAIALVPCVAYNFYEKCEDCLDEKTCTLRREFSKIREKSRDIMKEITIQSFLSPVKRR